MSFKTAEPIGGTLLLSLLAALTLLPHPAHAQEDPLVTDRPDFTESPSSVQPGRVQLETGFTWEKAGETESQSFGEILVRIGLSEAIELRLAANSYARESTPEGDASGFESTLVGVKIETGRASSEPSFLKPATALLIGTTLPTGSTETRQPHLEPGVIYALDWNTGRPVGIASNLGLFYASDSGDQFVLGTFSTAIGFDLGRDWGAFFEYFNFMPEGPDRSIRHFLDAGLTVGLSEDFQLDIRIGSEISGETDYFAGLGLAYRW